MWRSIAWLVVVACSGSGGTTAKPTDTTPIGPTACQSDVDCVLDSSSGEFTCCNGACSQRAMHRTDLATYQARIAKLSCPKTLFCPPLPCTRMPELTAVCEAETCAAK